MRRFWGDRLEFWWPLGCRPFLDGPYPSKTCDRSKVMAFGWKSNPYMGVSFGDMIPGCDRMRSTPKHIRGWEMRFVVLRWFFCAGLFLFVAESNSQTTGARNGATAGATTDVRSGAGDNGSGYNGAGPNGSWKVLYEENFEDFGSLFKTGAPGWEADTYQTTDEFSDGGSYFKRLGVTPPRRFALKGPLERATG